ncbi:MAG: acyl-CoA thioesterase [Bacteroidales bacterium]
MQSTERSKYMETNQFRIVFGSSLNDRGKLFGGEALKWMDEVAYISALRYTHMKVVTVSVDKISFLQPIMLGSIIEIIGTIHKIGNVKIEIMVQIFVETLDSDERVKAVEAIFAFAATDQNNKLSCLNNNRQAKFDNIELSGKSH